MRTYRYFLLKLAALAVAMLVGISPAMADTTASAPQAAVKRTYYAEDIKATMQKYIDATVDENGVFHMPDDKTGSTLALKFVQIHDPVRQIGSDVYFACTDFHVLGEPKKLYDLDFWMNEKTGELKIYQSKVHKEPRRSLLYGWYKQPRYTFVDDEIEYLYQ